jgi:hypothetical protein
MVLFTAKRKRGDNEKKSTARELLLFYELFLKPEEAKN